MKTRKAIATTACFVIAAAGLLAVPTPALAYIGPGAGLSAIGTVLALIGAAIMGIVGFVWYPIKRLRAKLRKRSEGEESKSEH